MTTPDGVAGPLLAAAARAPSALDGLSAACVAARDAWGADRVSVWLCNLPARTASPLATSQDHDELQAFARRWSRLPLSDAPALAEAVDRGRGVQLGGASLATGLPAGFVDDFEITSTAIVPLRDGEMQGAMFIEPHCASPAAPALTEATHVFALLAARMVATREARLSEQQLGLLMNLADSVAEQSSAGETLTAACEALSAALGSRRASVWLRRKGRLVPFTAGYADGHRDTAGLTQFRSAEAPDIIRRVIDEGAPQTAEADEIGSWWRTQFDLGAILAVPIGRHPDLVGVLVVDSGEVRRFSDHHVKLAGAVAANLATLLRLVRLSQLRERELERLKEASEVKNVFLSAVSHELRTPLTVILGLSATLDRRGGELDAATARKLTARMHHNAQKLERLLLDLLDVDRLTRSRVEPERVETDVAELVRDTVEAFPHPEHAIVLDLAPVMARIDPSQAERIVENLVSNACKYSSPGTQIDVCTEATADGVRITVMDRGPGVPEEARDTVFEPFHRLDETHPSPGTGVGLTLVAKFAELHGGTAIVEDRDGGGARFVIELPSDGPAG